LDLERRLVPGGRGGWEECGGGDIDNSIDEGGTTHTKKSRKEQACELGNDGNDHHEFNYRKSETATVTTEHDQTSSEMTHRRQESS